VSGSTIFTVDGEGWDVKCYIHSEREALGVCSYCHRAVCRSCIRIDNRQLFCSDHNSRMLSLEFTKRYLEAIDLAREAGMKAIPIKILIERLEADLSQGAR
jgi:hypothetical protein